MLGFFKRYSGKAPKRVVAIVAARNEQYTIRQCVEDLLSNGLEVAVLDNESTDETPEIIKSISHKLAFHGTIPFDGTFRLYDILQAKRSLAKELDADWMVHVDSDEILHSCNSGETLRQGIERAAKEGANVVNFEEFVFLPKSDQEDYRNSDYVAQMKWYYHLDKNGPWLMRAFRPAEVSNLDGAGHRVKGKVRLHRENFVKCHYICLSFEGLRAKVRERKYARQSLERGWSRSRAALTPERIKPSDGDKLLFWQDGRVESLDRSQPVSMHFWDWDKPPA